MRKNTFASFSLLNVLAIALSLGLVFYLLDSNSYHQDQTLFGGLSWFLGQAILLLLLRRGLAKSIVINLSLLLSVTIINATVWTSAGIVAIEAPLLLLVPLIALSTLGRISGLAWLFLISVNILALAFAPSAGIAFTLPTFETSWFVAAGIFLLVVMSCTFGLIRILQMENRKLQKELSQLVDYHRVKSCHDGLTQLLNKDTFKETFERQIARAEYESKCMTLLIVDLNRFKQINDNFGHLVGDEVIKGVANNLKLGLRAGDIAGRIGGDEFAILLEDVGKESDISARVAALKRSIRQEVATKIGMISVDAAIGASVFSRDGECFNSLYEAADVSMYQDKREWATVVVD